MSRNRFIFATRIVAAASLLLIVGCTSIKRQPVPIADIDRAMIPGMPDVRDWGDEPSPHFQEDLIQSVRDEREATGSGPGSRPMRSLGEPDGSGCWLPGWASEVMTSASHGADAPASAARRGPRGARLPLGWDPWHGCG